VPQFPTNRLRMTTLKAVREKTELLAHHTSKTMENKKNKTRRTVGLFRDIALWRSLEEPDSELRTASDDVVEEKAEKQNCPGASSIDTGVPHRWPGAAGSRDRASVPASGLGSLCSVLQSSQMYGTHGLTSSRLSDHSAVLTRW
jgi:hypothetical protein